MCMQLKHVYSKRCDPLIKLSSIIPIIRSTRRSACVPCYVQNSWPSQIYLGPLHTCDQLRAMRRNGLGLKISHGHGWGSKDLTTRNLKSLFLIALAYGA